jgi:hypothetical protein
MKDRWKLVAFCIILIFLLGCEKEPERQPPEAPPALPGTLEFSESSSSDEITGKAISDYCCVVSDFACMSISEETCNANNGNYIQQSCESLDCPIMPDWATFPGKDFVFNVEIKRKANLVVESEADYIYKYVYAFNSSGNRYRDLLDQAPGPDGNFVEDFGSTEFGLWPGTFYVAVYACNLLNGDYDCNNRKWMLKKIIIEDKCGNGICEIFENPGNCPKDCIIPELIGSKTYKTLIVEFEPQNTQYGKLFYCQNRISGYIPQTLEQYCENKISEHNFLEILNNPDKVITFDPLREGDTKNYYSLFYINDYLRKEADRYDVDEIPYFDIDLQGPFTLDDLPPKTILFNMSLVDPYFDNKIEELGIDSSQYDHVIVIYFNDNGLITSMDPVVRLTEDRHAFVNHYAGRGKLYINADTSRIRTSLYPHVITHELLHSFGATDKYVFGEGANAPSWCSMFECCTEDGVPEPGNYPQTKGCAMCAGGQIVEVPGKEARSPRNLMEDVIICNKTAEEIGWVTECGNGICEEGEDIESCPEDCIVTEFESCDNIQHGECSGLRVCDDGVLKESVLNCGCPIDKVIIDGECKSLSYSETVKVAIIEVISEDFEVPVTTYHCNEERCNTGIPLCEPEETGCEQFEINFVDAINNPMKVTSIHLAGEPMSPGKFLFDIPLGPWYSFYYVDDWFAQQAKDITGSRQEKMDISIFGPYEVSNLPPERGRTDACYEILNPYFEDIADQNNINLDEFDVINYVYFDDPSRGTGRFLSCASRDGLTFNNILASIDNINSEIKTVAHETAHILGASDKYDGSFCEIPEGIPEPDKSPLYPQTKACLMCGNIMLGESQSGTSVPITKTVICNKTAEELGWVTLCGNGICDESEDTASCPEDCGTVESNQVAEEPGLVSKVIRSIYNTTINIIRNLK